MAMLINDQTEHDDENSGYPYLAKAGKLSI
jgi:hypothetical protein